MNTNTKTSKVTLKELPELLDAYLSFKTAGDNFNSMRSLMNLLQEQTPFIQKRFWALVDAQVGAW